MKTFAHLLPILQQAKQELMARYPITEMGIFGSYARGEADQESDLDILIDYRPSSPFTFFDLLDAEHDLTLRTGIPVRFSFRSSIAKNPYLEDNIMKDIRFL